jgi:hypothetical protein
MFEIWIRAIKPGLAGDKAVDAYEILLAEEPNPTLGTAVKWVAIGGVIAGVIIGFAVLIFGVVEGQFLENLLLRSIGSVIASPILLVLVFVISSVIMLGIAKALGGQGNLDNQSYMLAAVSAPMSIIFAALQIIPGLVGSLISLSVAVYTSWLSMMVLRALHQYSGGRAVLTVLIFLAVIIGLFFLVVFPLVLLLFWVLLQILWKGYIS